MGVVVCVPGGSGDPWELPASELVDRQWIYGGMRSLYEFAAAAASLDHDVELRGELSPGDLDEICEAAGARPRVGMGPRKPTADDLVVLADGDALQVYARAALSPARRAALLLGPPGLFGPPLRRGFAPPDPLTVDRSSLARAEDFHALESLGFEMWTNSPRLADHAAAAGTVCTFIGTGQPLPWPEPGPKTYDVGFVAANRWAPLVRRVVERLRFSCLEIGEGDRTSILRGLAAARILILPVRFEGQSRIQLEARSVGTVPLALSSNPYSQGLNESGGGVLVDSIEEMAPAIERLLSRPRELEDRAARAVKTARAQADWSRFRTRVKAALSAAPRERPSEALAAIGQQLDQLGELVGDLRDDGARLEDDRVKLESGIRWLRGRLEASENHLKATSAEVEWLREVLHRVEAERDAAREDIRALRGRRSVRIALRAAAILRRRGRWPEEGEGSSDHDPPV
jgi:glycosyltransferase involved in cell wall biosynthesis